MRISASTLILARRHLRSSIPRLVSTKAPLHHTRLFSSTRIMSDATPVYTANAAPVAGPYSQAIKTPTAIYCSGQIPMKPDGSMVEGTIGEKTAQCITNLGAVLAEAGSSLAKVVKVNVFLSDMEHFAGMNVEFAKGFPQKPARSCVAVKTLPKNVDVEIECIALP